MDFVSDGFVDGRRLRCLNIVDDFTKECLAIEVDTSLPGRRVVSVLERLAEMRGLPISITVDNGPEFISKALDAWAYEQQLTSRFIEPGAPQQNAYIERYNRTVRHEWLDQYIIETIEEAQHHATQWLWTYNNERPNMGIGGITPAQKLKMAA